MDVDRPRKPTLDTVAGAVGVSRATVSNAYNRPDQLSAALRERILETAAALGYPGPDPVARSLATRHSAAVAFMLGQQLSASFSDPALSIVLDGLASTVDGHDHCLVLMPGGADRGGPRPQTVARAQADVVVAYSLPDDAPALAAVRARGLPMVVIDQPVLPDTARVEVDDAGGARLAAAHLLELGHRRFAVVTFSLRPDGGNGPASPARLAEATFRVSRDRLTGYLSELRAAGVVDVPVWECSGSRRELSRSAGRTLLTGDDRPTAVLCASDELAFGVLQAARDLGLAVPEDVSVVGFDDVPAAEHAEPPLTTVRQPLVDKGRHAGELALRLLDGGRPGPPTRLAVTLVERASTALHT
ncbi:LacI family DNA-binding transcriptional regulator [Saccharothrix coeruleofusca]|uniref:Transcriptional regulator n=1 Tax=Saccharothrix coeruleofusca TaxID=33919 RepID=A0A918ECG6_9PSEU|nr:substrate-binding domain-containing protein [Saccharothrix coeruleofusca]MBP2334122.1 DNA-binding LacI/PurR family transcriptional regulator [Saccharothrix coeruleofusca]GGP43299.1 transcriptional regulator [Saccharothrix coeruleofusca]